MNLAIALGWTLALAACVQVALATTPDHDQAKAELDRRVALARDALNAGDARGAVNAFHDIATFYRGGGDRRSAAVADLEAARLLVGLGSWDEAFATLAPSEGDEVESAGLAQRQHIRAVVLERRGDAAGARDAIVSVRRVVTREDWHRHLADDAKRLGVSYGWPALDRGTLGPILVLEWIALGALVVILYRRGAASRALTKKGPRGALFRWRRERDSNPR